MKPTEKPLVSVVVRAFNESRHIQNLFTEIFRQKVDFPFEVILVDSGSTDGTLDIAARFPVTIISISPDDFTFGYSLNRGIKEATGEYCVIISAHCYPYDDTWLARLISPFTDPKVAVSFGQQRGNEITKYSEHQIFAQWFPDVSSDDYPIPFTNNANSAIRREIWRQTPYEETLAGLEDIHWAKKIKGRGLKIAYRADAVVIHVHEESSRQIYRRYYREALAYKEIFPKERFGLFDFFRFFFSNSWSDSVHAVLEKKFSENFFDILRFRFLQFWATYRGHSFNVPVSKEMQRRLYYSRAPRLNNGMAKSSSPIARPPTASTSERAYIDISAPLHANIPVWPGAERFNLEWKKDYDSCGCNESRISMNIHTGTHMDAPFHFDPAGARIRDVSLEKMIGPAIVLEHSGTVPISVEFLVASSIIERRIKRILFKTENSRRLSSEFDPSFIALSTDAAKWIAKQNIDLIGMDGPSVQSFSDRNNHTHEVLLKAGVVLLEGLILRDVDPGAYDLLALPLNIPEAEGAPVRAVLTRLESFR